MNRRELDELVAHYQLAPLQVERTLAIARARPTSREAAQFATRALLLAGVLSLAAGIVFLVAANWSELRIIGRFVLLEALLAVALALAYWRPPPRPLGQYALLAAFMLAGALLALFGQTYQTGANVYELFLSWTVLGLPLVIAGQSRPTLGGVDSGTEPRSRTLLWPAPRNGCVLDAVRRCLEHAESPAHRDAGEHRAVDVRRASARADHRREGLIAPLGTPSVRRLVIASAIVFATWGGTLAILGFGHSAHTDGSSVLWVFGALAAIGFYTWRRRTDVFPLTLIAASVILLVMFVIIKNASGGRTDFLAMSLAIAVWLIVSSSVTARVILNLMRSWRAGGAST